LTISSSEFEDFADDTVDISSRVCAEKSSISSTSARFAGRPSAFTTAGLLPAPGDFAERLSRNVAERDMVSQKEFIGEDILNKLIIC
jgi:hypothetical protein